MPLIVSQIPSPLSASKEDILFYAAKKAGLSPGEIHSAAVHKTSLDARKRENIHFVSSVYFELLSPEREKLLAKSLPFCSFVMPAEMSFPKGPLSLKHPPVIAGFGPAGMFAGLLLAEAGFRPVILERGEAIDQRVEKVSRYWQEGVLDPESNVQFGEGGAGTFSDGKLTTRIKDPHCGWILKKFVEFGAPEEILTKAKPHIGTDRLREVVKNIRERIIALGGTVRFSSRLTGITVNSGKISGISVNGVEEPAETLILAIGHSARDTFEMLLKHGIFIEPKPFSVGARIEHSQQRVDESLYGKYAGNPLLPPGEYQLSHRQGERCVYTFCMCPGGYVVPSASEPETVVTNGMSEFSRNGANANAALVVSVSEKDFPSHPLGGVDFARSLERKAFLLGGKTGSAPGVSVGSFLEKRSEILKASVPATYSLEVVPADFDQLFPSEITEMMRTGLRKFSQSMACFGDKNALLTGAETRTSSPVRIKRNDELQSVSFKNLYPCGEGAGYAGGIMSAAADGVRVALKIMETYNSHS